MDEPLSNLDARLRLSMRGEIKRLCQRLGATTLYVTHDQAEALTMADLIAVMSAGELQQLASPDDIYQMPANLDVWEWTPLMFLILLAGLQSLPQEPFEAALVDGAGPWRTFLDFTLPMMRPVLAIAIVLRTIDAFGTFDQVFVLTHGGPGEATKVISVYGYEVAFKFQQTGYAAALFVTVGLIVLAFAIAAVRLLRRAEPA